MTKIDSSDWRLAAGGAAALAVVVAAGFWLRDTVPPADAWIAGHLYAVPGSLAAGVATAVGGVGTLICLIALIAGGVAVSRRYGKRARGFLLRTVPIAPLAAAVLLLQQVVARPGPPRQPQLGTYPSGHVAVVTALAATAIVLYGALGRAWRRAALVCGAAAVGCVAASRVVLAEHWLVDTVAAVVAATGVALMVLVLLRVRPAVPEPPAA